MIRTIYVNNENKAVFICPACTKARTLDVSKFLAVKSNARIRAKCPCGHTYSVILERRKYYRKATNFAGVYTTRHDKREWPISITNLSRSGLEFTTSNVKNLKAGDQVDIEFRLDDSKKSLIKKRVTIRKIQGQQVGAEFFSIDQYDKAIGFYLFN